MKTRINLPQWQRLRLERQPTFASDTIIAFSTSRSLFFVCFFLAIVPYSLVAPATPSGVLSVKNFDWPKKNLAQISMFLWSIPERNPRDEIQRSSSADDTATLWNVLLEAKVEQLVRFNHSKHIHVHNSFN